MSETKPRRLSGRGERKPIAVNFSFKGDDPNYKQKQLKPGLKLKGAYLTTFRNVHGGYTFISHLIDDEKLGPVTVPGCGATNHLETLGRGSLITLEYQGKGNPKPGKRAPYLFDILVLNEVEKGAAAAAKPKSAAVQEDFSDVVEDAIASEEDADEETPF